jgi:hypothetical protein
MTYSPFGISENMRNLDHLYSYRCRWRPSYLSWCSGRFLMVKWLREQSRISDQTDNICQLLGKSPKKQANSNLNCISVRVYTPIQIWIPPLSDHVPQNTLKGVR